MGPHRRGDLRFWLDEVALAGWQALCRTTPDVQLLHSDLAIKLVLIRIHPARTAADGLMRLVSVVS